MHGTAIKVINAQQAKLHNTFKNTKLKLLKTNAAIWFNKMCKAKQLTPKYFDIKINGNSIQARNTRLAATSYRINQELKFLLVRNKGSTKNCTIFPWSVPNIGMLCGSVCKQAVLLN